MLKFLKDVSQKQHVVARNDKALAKELDFQQRMKAFLEEGTLQSNMKQKMKTN